jgi:catechol 2,3-dioxygenase-like lactoylglutathione lyase family enzyme
MLENARTFHELAVDDLQQAQAFYGDTLGLSLEHPDGGSTLLYLSPDLQVGNYTALNFLGRRHRRDRRRVWRPRSGVDGEVRRRGYRVRRVVSSAGVTRRRTWASLRARVSALGFRTSARSTGRGPVG